MNNYRTDQENFWAGEFGDNYSDRNQSEILQSSNLAFFLKIFAQTRNVQTVIEFGANIGLNLKAIRQFLPHAELAAVEINKKAIDVLRSWGQATVYHQSILDFTPEQKSDFVFSKGVLIHIDPEKLDMVYQKLYDTSNRYICVAEYYNPVPIEVNYRGHTGKLFKRDFAGEILKKFGDIELIDYGFNYHGDPLFPQDDITWFLMKKIDR